MNSTRNKLLLMSLMFAGIANYNHSIFRFDLSLNEPESKKIPEFLLKFGEGKHEYLFNINLNDNVELTVSIFADNDKSANKKLKTLTNLNLDIQRKRKHLNLK